MMFYLLKVNVLLAVFYGFYRLLFVRDTFFVWRRVTLLLLIVSAIIIPMADIGWWVSSHEQTANLSEIYREVMLPTVTITGNVDRFPWMRLFSFVYMGGVVVLMLRIVWQIFVIIRMSMMKERQMIHGLKVFVMTDEASPFSFFNWIFVNPQAQSSEQLRKILIHEQAHVRQCHSIDILLMELLTVFCWWNPFVWLMRREARLNLEYLADERVMASGNERRAYQYHLLGLAYGKNVATVSNNFNVLPLKLRIRMMNKRRTNKWMRVKYLLLVPLTALALVACNLDSSSQKPSNEAKGEFAPDDNEAMGVLVNIDKDAVQGVDTGQAIGDPSKAYFDVVEQMPQFPGGAEELMKFLQKNIKYPEEAKGKGVQGRVVVTFIVAEDGSVEEPYIARKVDPLLDAEALRVIKLMPKWKPGMQSGKFVRVKYNVPVTFRLQ